MKTFSVRFQELLDGLNISAYKLAKEIGTSDAVVSNVRTGKSNPSFEFLEKLLNKYEAINANWLICERGEKFNQPGFGVKAKQNPDLLTAQKEIIALQAENIRLKDQKIQELTEVVRTYKKAEEYLNLVKKKKSSKPGQDKGK